MTTRYDFGAIVAIDGSIRCLDGDRFENISVGADMEITDAVEAGRRVGRIEALAAASICAVEKTTAKMCAALAKGLSDRSFKDFRQAKVRGEKFPGGEAEKEFASGTAAYWTIVQGSMLFQFFGKRGG